MPDNELLSIEEVARLWGTGIGAVVNSIRAGQLLSLDRGLLAEEGKLAVPTIRRSWAEAPRKDSEGFERILDPPEGEPSHPAAQAAFDFHKALDTGDAEGLAERSSAVSRIERSSDDLLATWRATGPHLTQRNAGVGTAIYSLAPLDAVAARVFADAPTLPRAVTKATPATLIDALPLICEDDQWRVDLELFKRRGEWIHLLTAPLDSAGSSGLPSSGFSGD